MEHPVDINWNEVNRPQVFFTYSVTWKKSSTVFEDRFNKYLDSDFFEHKIHWFSIFNSFMMVVFLTGLVGVIFLKALRRDFARYEKVEELGDMVALWLA
jgi:transmembrane 9 superfamily protein 3